MAGSALQSHSCSITETRRKAFYTLGIAAVIGYPILVAYTLHRDPSDFWFDTIGGALFFVFYLMPLMLLRGNIDATDRGLSVGRWRKSFIEYSDVVGCYGVFWFPFQTAILVTKRQFPLKIVITGDEIEGRRRSLFQRGRLALSVMAMKASYEGQ